MYILNFYIINIIKLESFTFFRIQMLQICGQIKFFPAFKNGEGHKPIIFCIYEIWALPLSVLVMRISYKTPYSWKMTLDGSIEDPLIHMKGVCMCSFSKLRLLPKYKFMIILYVWAVWNVVRLINNIEMCRKRYNNETAKK